jgi:hypothetical protein
MADPHDRAMENDRVSGMTGCVIQLPTGQAEELMIRRHWNLLGESGKP